MRSVLLACSLAFLCACATTKHVAEEKRSPAPASASQDVEPVYKVIPLRYASANDLAGTVRAALPSMAGRRLAQVVPDERTNSVVVTCTPGDFAKIERLIAQLDIEIKKP